MGRRRGHTEEQIIAVLRQAECWTTVTDLCRNIGISEQMFYTWKRKYAGLGLSELRELRQLQEENTKLTRLVADLSLDQHMLQRLSEKSCKASGPAGTGPLGADDLSGQRAPGPEAAADRPRLFVVSESARSSRGIADAVAQVGRGTGPIRISATDGVAETGWVARECQAHLSTLYGRRADGTHEGGGPSPCAAT